MTITEPSNYDHGLLAGDCVRRVRSPDASSAGVPIPPWIRVVSGVYSRFDRCPSQAAPPWIPESISVARRQRVLWEFTMILIGASAAFMIAGAIVSSIGRGRCSNREMDSSRADCECCGLCRSRRPAWISDQHFNHNDFYHVIQIVGFWCLLRVLRQDSRNKVVAADFADLRGFNHV